MVTQPLKSGELVYHLRDGTLYRVMDTPSQSGEEQSPSSLLPCEPVTVGAPLRETYWLPCAGLVKVKDLVKPEVRQLVDVFTRLPRPNPDEPRRVRV